MADRFSACDLSLPERAVHAVGRIFAPRGPWWRVASVSLVLRPLARNLDASANFALVAASLLLLGSLDVIKSRDSQFLRQQALFDDLQVAADFSSSHRKNADVSVLGAKEISSSSVADFMRVPAISSAEGPNLLSLDPYFLKKMRSPNLDDDTSKTTPTRVAHTSLATNLPWNAVEPVRFLDDGKQRHPNRPNAVGEGGDKGVTAFGLPSTELWLTWVRTNIKIFNGSEHRRALMHFELWLEPSRDIKDRMSSVSYDLRSQAVQPRQQESRNAEANFRAGFGGFACAREILITVHFDDGRSQTIEVDGCTLMASNGPKRRAHKS